MNGRDIEHDLSEFFRRTETPEPSLRLRAAVAAARVESPRSRLTTFRRPRTAFSLLGLAASIVLAAGVLMVVTSRPDRNGPANPGSVASAISTLMTQLPSAPIPTASPTPKPGFSVTGLMSTPRAGATATRLLDGRVLIAGGVGSSALQVHALDSAELYDPKTGTFSSTGSMHDYRWGATATLLPDGGVLIAGGASGSDIFGSPSLALASAELYDPATGVFKLTGWMTTPRELHTATLLPDGRVLLVGGFGATIFPTSAELYDPKTGKFSPTGSMAAARYQHTATLLADGRVLIAGGLGREGINSTPLASAELYDPTTSTFGSAGSMTTTRVGHTATRLSDGQVLIVGGGSTSAELYDPKTGKFSPTGSMATLRLGHTATLLSGGRVLIVGGVEDTSATTTSTDLVPEMYDPSTAKFSPAGSMTMYRSAHTATLLSDGRILVAGGNDASNNPQASAELYQP